MRKRRAARGTREQEKMQALTGGLAPPGLGFT